MSSWMKSKADCLLSSQIAALSRSQFPEPNLAEGMVQMAYATGLIDDAELGYWTQRISSTVAARRKALGEERIQRILAEGPRRTA